MKSNLELAPAIIVEGVGAVSPAGWGVAPLLANHLVSRAPELSGHDAVGQGHHSDRVGEQGGDEQRVVIESVNM